MASAQSTVTAPTPRARQAELARLLGVSRQAIGDLVKRAILEVGRDGKIDVALARLALEQRVRPSSKTAQALGTATLTPPTAASVLLAPPSEPSQTTPVEPAAESTDDSAVTSYHVAKTLREVAEARLAQLRLAEARGELVRAADVRAAQARRLAALRESLLQLPARLAPVLAAEADAARCHETLQAELHAVLEQMTEGVA